MVFDNIVEISLLYGTNKLVLRQYFITTAILKLKLINFQVRTLINVRTKRGQKLRALAPKKPVTMQEQDCDRR